MTTRDRYAEAVHERLAAYTDGATVDQLIADMWDRDDHEADVRCEVVAALVHLAGRIEIDPDLTGEDTRYHAVHGRTVGAGHHEFTPRTEDTGPTGPTASEDAIHRQDHTPVTARPHVLPAGQRALIDALIDDTGLYPPKRRALSALLAVYDTLHAHVYGCACERPDVCPHGIPLTDQLEAARTDRTVLAQHVLRPATTEPAAVNAAIERALPDPPTETT